MSSVDDRVVAMKFDNSAFQSKVMQTIGILAKLKTSMDFTKSKTAIADVGKSANNFHLNGMATAIDQINSKFSLMGAVALSVINNVVTRAISAGIQITKALTVAPVMDGFREYETNMNSIQTILANTASKGSTLKDVNGALETLNAYSDQTIYNFSEMARNIGTFTAAGVDLDTSTNAIKGIANLAAISGSNSGQASTAMYQLSQAIATGTVKLMDWNSVTNAGMGGEVFKTALFETGKALGTIKDVPMGQTFEEWENAGNKFRETLQDGWLTGEVLTTTLQGFTGDLTKAQVMALGYSEKQAKEVMRLGALGKASATEVKTLTQLLSTVKETIGSGWSKSFKLVFGDFKQAKKMFTQFNDVISGVANRSADARNSLLEGWNKLGGRKVLIESITNAFSAMSKIFNVVKEAFQNIFPPMTSDRLFELTERLRDFTANLTLSEPTLQAIRRVFLGVFSVLRIGIEIIMGIGGVFKTLFKELAGFDDGKGGALGYLSDLGFYLVSLKEKLVDSGGIADFFANISKKISAFFDIIRGNKAPEELSGAMKKLGSRFGFVATGAKKLLDGFKWIWKNTDKIRQKIVEFAGDVKDSIMQIPGKIVDSFKNAEYDKAVDALNLGILAGFVIVIKKFLDGFKNMFVGGEGLFDSVKGSLDGLTGTLTAMQSQIKADALFRIAAAIGLLTASVLVLSMIDSRKLTKALTAMAVGFGQLIASLTILTKLSTGPKGAMQLAILAQTLILMAGAVLLLSISVAIFSRMDLDALAKGVAGVTAMMLALAGTAKIISKNSRGMFRAGLGIIFLSIGINILAIAVKQFSKLNWEEMLKGLVGVAGGLTAIAFGMRKMPWGLVTKGAGLILISSALLILSKALKSLAQMSWGDLLKGVAGVAAGLKAISFGISSMPLAMMPLMGIGLILIATALKLMVGVLKSFAKMDYSEMTRGLAGVAGVLTVLAVASNAMSSAIFGAVSILIMSVALKALAGTVTLFAKMKWSVLLKGLAGLAVAIAGIALISVLLVKAVPFILALAIALGVLGLAFALFGVGASLTAAAFGVLASAGSAGLDFLKQALELFIKYLPSFLEQLAKGLIEFAKVIIDAAPEIIASLGEVLVAILDLIAAHAPQLVAVMVMLIEEGLAAIKEFAPELIDTGWFLIRKLLQGIRQNISTVTKMVMTILTEFIRAMAANIQPLIDAGAEFLVNFLQGIADNLDSVLTAAGDVVAEFILGLANEVKKISTAGEDLVTAIVEGIGGMWLALLDAGLGVIGDFIDGLALGIPALILKAIDLVVAVCEAIGAASEPILDAAFKMVIAFLEGISTAINNNAQAVNDAAWDVVNAIVSALVTSLTTALSNLGPLGRVIAEGLDIVIGDPAPKEEKKAEAAGKKLQGRFVAGLTDDRGHSEAIKSLGTKFGEKMKRAFGKIPTGMLDTQIISPTIRPVLDLTDIEKGSAGLSRMLNGQKLGADVSYRSANGIIDATLAQTQDDAPAAQPVRDIKFEQTIIATQPLKLREIFKQTRSQIDLAKQELKV